MTNLTVAGFDWSMFLAYLGVGLLGLGMAGSAIGLSIAGCAVTGMRSEKRTSGIAVAVLPGTQGLYSFVIGFLCMNALGAVDPAKASLTYVVVFAAGLLTGLSCLFSGWWQGVVCAAGAKSINQDRMPMGQALLLAVFPEFYAILGFVLSILLLGSIGS